MAEASEQSTPESKDEEASNGPTPTSKAVAKRPRKRANEAKEPAYGRPQLIAVARERLDIEPYVLAGALSDIGGDGPVTVTQAKEAVEKFLKREVKKEV